MQYLKNAQPISEISLLDRAFHYGDGCFTTARIFNNHIELFQRHIVRLQQACQRLSLQADLGHIEESLVHLVSRLHVLNGTLKIVISRGDGQRGYSFPDHPADVWVMYYPAVLKEHEYAEIQGGVASQRLGLTMPSLVGIKSLNRLEQVMLKDETDQKLWNEALVLDVNGQIVEGVSSNCFIHINNQWITPELRYNGVHGVMRAEILARMQAAKVHCAQRSISEDEIPQIDGLFFCNALSPMKIMTQLDEKSLSAQPCIDLFHTLQLNQIQ